MAQRFDSHETHGFFERPDLCPSSVLLGRPPPAREVTITELDRFAPKVMARVSYDGEVAVVSRHGLPIALILPLNDAISLLPHAYLMSENLRALERRFQARAERRYGSALIHARTRRGPHPRR